MAFHHIVRLLLTAVIRRFDAQAEKFGVSLSQIHDFGLFRAYVQSQSAFQPVLHCIKQFPRLLVAFREQLKIIGITHTGNLF